MKQFIFILLIPFLSFSAIKNKKINFNDFKKYQFAFTKEEIENKIKTYLEKDQKIQNFYQLTDKAFVIGDISANKIDYILYLATSKKRN